MPALTKNYYDNLLVIINIINYARPAPITKKSKQLAFLMWQDRIMDIMINV